MSRALHASSAASLPSGKGTSDLTLCVCVWLEGGSCADVGMSSIIGEPEIDESGTLGDQTSHVRQATD